MFDHPVAVEDVVIEKAQGAHRLIEHCPCDLFPLNQKQLVLADVFGSEPIRRESEMLSEFRYAADVSVDRVGRVVAQPQFLDHSLAQFGHDETPFG